jgi:hypothetical protein
MARFKIDASNGLRKSSGKTVIISIRIQLIFGKNTYFSEAIPAFHYKFFFKTKVL